MADKFGTFPAINLKKIQYKKQHNLYVERPIWSDVQIVTFWQFIP